MRMAASNFFPDLDVKPFSVTVCPARSLRAVWSVMVLPASLAYIFQPHPSTAIHLPSLVFSLLFVEHCHIRPVFLTGWPQRGQSPQSCASVFVVRVTASALRFAVASAGIRNASRWNMSITSAGSRLPCSTSESACSIRAVSSTSFRRGSTTSVRRSPSVVAWS